MSVKQPCIDCGVLIRTPSKRCRACHAVYQRGENSPRWKGGITQDMTSYVRGYRARNPQKTLARSKVARAIEAGRFVRQSCQWPGCDVGPEKTQAHHWSYEPGHELDVTCFCRCHHRLVDRMTREQFEFIRAAATPRAKQKPAKPSWWSMLMDQRRAVSNCKED